MFLVRILTMKRQFEQFDRQLEKLRSLAGRQCRVEEITNEAAYQ